MSIISRYLGLTFLKNWLMALFAFIILYTAIDFLEKIGDFLAKDISIGTILLFFAAQLPKVMGLMAPVATVVAVMVTLAVMARASEIVAFKAGGVSLYRLGAPVLAVGGFICLAMFLISDILAPPATAVANRIWQGQVRERIEASAVVEDVWLKAVRQIQHLGAYNESDGSVTRVTLLFFDDEGGLTRRIEAQSGRMAEGRLSLNDVTEKIYRSTEGADGRPQRAGFTVTRHRTYTIDNWPAPPAGFGRALENSDKMSVAQLWRTINRLSAEGFGPTRQRVDLQFKFSFAFLSLIMVVVGLPIGFWKEKGGSVALGIALGLALSFAYLIIMELARSLGYSGLLPAFIAAWLPNMIFLLFGAYLFSYVRQ
jgi:lipopolysaccharide export system permease protein